MAGLKFWKTKKARLSDTVEYINQKCKGNEQGIIRLKAWIDRAPYLDAISEALSLGYSLFSSERSQTNSSERRAIRACLLTRMMVEAPHNPSDAQQWITEYKPLNERILQGVVLHYLNQLGIMTSGQLAANYAIACARDHKSPGATNLNLMCWDAVVSCQYRSGAINDETYKNLINKIRGDTYASYSRFVSTNDPLVGNPAAMYTVPPGSTIGIFEKFPDANKSARLTHAMIAIGRGRAAGNKNRSCLGDIGNLFGWEEIDLQHKLQWNPKTEFCGISTIERFDRTLPESALIKLIKF